MSEVLKIMITDQKVKNSKSCRLNEYREIQNQKVSIYLMILEFYLFLICFKPEI
jgi:hypothetical protein